MEQYKDNLNEAIQLCAEYIDGRIESQRLMRLHHLLVTDSQARQVYAKMISLRMGLETIFRGKPTTQFPNALREVK